MTKTFFIKQVPFRNLAAARNINLEVYSGTFGVTSLRDINGQFQEIWLSLGTTRQIPAPKIYYKILLNHADDSGVVLIGVNNRHLTLDEIRADHIICPDVSDLITYINWQRQAIDRGYSYACTVADFVSVVPHMNVRATNLLV